MKEKANKSMKKNVVLSIGAAIILAAIIIVSVIFAVNNGRNMTNSTYKAIKACDLLSLEEAKTLLGDGATLGEHNDPETGNVISTSNCSYTNGESSLSALRTVSIMVRSPLSKDGQDSNTTAFESTNGSVPAAGDEEVAGYGDKAFWDTTVHRLAILKDNAWIQVGYGGSDQTTNTLSDAKKVADLVLAKRF